MQTVPMRAAQMEIMTYIVFGASSVLQSKKEIVDSSLVLDFTRLMYLDFTGLLDTEKAFKVRLFAAKNRLLVILDKRIRVFELA